MSYEPTNWKAGDTVTSAKLNKMEQGIAASGGILIAHVIANGKLPTLDKTWQEIHDADVCYIVNRDDESSGCRIISATYLDDVQYIVAVYDFNIFQLFSADSPNGTLTLTITEDSGAQ